MFWIFKFIPDLFWVALLVAGLSGYFFNQIITVKTYQLPIKILSGAVVLATIFIFGIMYCNKTWTQAAKDLEDKVAAMETEAAQVTETIKEKVVIKTKVIQQRGQDIVQYVDREVTKTDAGCVISPEFISVHNRAAEPPR